MTWTSRQLSDVRTLMNFHLIIQFTVIQCIVLNVGAFPIVSTPKPYCVVIIVGYVN